MLVIDEEHRILDFLKGRDPEEIIFWVGAGVSYPQLPIGLSLTRMSLEFICGPHFLRFLESYWKRVNQIIEAGSGRKSALGPLPRLESVLAEIVGIQDSLSCCNYDFLSGMKAFLHAPLNLKHIVLAKFVECGSSVITTNFDDCIQRAYLAQTGTRMRKYREYGIHYYHDRIRKSGRIWHLHGTAELLDSVGVIVEQLKLINPGYQSYLNAIFDDEKMLVFLGYSASDAFDVTPFFLSKKKRSFPSSKAMFIQHGNKANSVPGNIDKYLQSFGDYLIGLGDTERILVSFLKSTGNYLSVGSLEEKEKLKLKEWDWKREFRKNVNLDDSSNINAFATLGIAHRLGLNIDLFDSRLINRANDIKPYISNKFFHDRLALTHDDRCSLWGQIKHTILTHPEKRHIIHFLNSLGLHSISQRYGNNVEILEKMADSNMVLVWDYEYTDLASICRTLISRYLSTKTKVIEHNDLCEIKKSAEISYKLGYRDLDKVVYINQLATALRFNLVLDALAGEVSPRRNVIETIFEYYSENSSADGWTGTFRDLAIAALFRNKYHGIQNEELIISNYQTALRLAKVTRDCKELRLLKKVGKVITSIMSISALSLTMM